jgi:hypothetical protein
MACQIGPRPGSSFRFFGAVLHVGRATGRHSGASPAKSALPPASKT